MNFRYVSAAFALVASACTFTPQGNGVQADFHPPLVNHYWELEHYTLKSGAKACTLSSGYNGITVYLSRKPEGEWVEVKSNRTITPGATLSLNAGGANYQTSSTYFPASSAHDLLAHLAMGGKAYLEWSEFSGPSGAQRVRVQNIVRLDDFAAQLKECRDSL